MMNSERAEVQKGRTSVGAVSRRVLEKSRAGDMEWKLTGSSAECSSLLLSAQPIGVTVPF